MATPKVYFGRADRIKEIPAPESGMGFVNSSDTEITPLVSGGRAVYRAPLTYKTHSLSWKTGAAKLQHIIDCYNGQWGSGPFYITDPTASDYNVLPARWSLGWQLAYQANGWCKPYVSAVTPGADSPYVMAVNRKATFTQATSGTVPVEGVLRTRVIKEPNKPYYLTMDGSATGGAGIRVRGYNLSTGVWDVISTVTTFGSPVLLVAAATATYSLLELDFYMPLGSTMTLRGMALSALDITRPGNLLRTNLATNPSFETAGSPVTVRTNICRNPSMETDLSGYAANQGTGAATLSRVTSGGYTGSSFARTTWTTATTDAGFLEYSITSLGALTGNTVYTFSAWLRSSVAITVTPRVSWANGNTLISQSLGTPVALSANTWTRVSFTTPASPATANGGWFNWPITGTLPVNATMDIDGMLLEQSGVLGTYFDGSYTGTGDFTYGWAGTAHASASVATAPSTPGWTPVSGTPVYRTTSDSYSGTASTAMVVNGQGQGAYQGFAAAAASPNTVYTISAWVKGPAGQKFRQDFDFTTNGSNWAVASYNGLQTFTGAWQRTSVTLTTPAGTQTIATGIKSDSAFSGTILVDAILVEQSASVGDYFDGSTQPAAAAGYYWNGTAHGSASVMMDTPPVTTLPVGEGVGPVQFSGNAEGTLTSKVIDRIGLSIDLIEVQNVGA